MSVVLASEAADLVEELKWEGILRSTFTSVGIVSIFASRISSLGRKGMQSEDDEEPSDKVSCPDGHGTHEPVLDALLLRKVPAGQGIQEPSTSTVPGEQLREMGSSDCGTTSVCSADVN